MTRNLILKHNQDTDTQRWFYKANTPTRPSFILPKNVSLKRKATKEVIVMTMSADEIQHKALSDEGNYMKIRHDSVYRKQ